MIWVKIQLDTAGDSNRVVKFADMDLFVETEGESAVFKAMHRPTGTASDPTKYHASTHDGWTIEDAKSWVLADCIRKVLK